MKEGRGNKMGCCLEFDTAYASKSIVKLKAGGWARVFRRPYMDHQQIDREQYAPLDRCPFCSKKLTSP